MSRTGRLYPSCPNDLIVASTNPSGSAQRIGSGKNDVMLVRLSLGLIPVGNDWGEEILPTAPAMLSVARFVALSFLFNIYMEPLSEISYPRVYRL